MAPPGRHLASRRVAERLGLVDRSLRVDPSDGEARLAYADRPLDAAYGAPAGDPGRSDPGATPA